MSEHAETKPLIINGILERQGVCADVRYIKAATCGNGADYSLWLWLCDSEDQRYENLTLWYGDDQRLRDADYAELLTYLRQQQEALPKEAPPKRVRLEFSQDDIVLHLGRMLEQRGYYIGSTAGEWTITPNPDGAGHTVTVYIEAEKK